MVYVNILNEIRKFVFQFIYIVCFITNKQNLLI